MDILNLPWRLYIAILRDVRYKGTSRVLLSKSNEPISTRGSISVHIMFLLFLASPVCVM